MSGQEKRVVRVVAAIIENEQGRILITQRRPQAFMPLKWEFPGGKVEAEESDEEALQRELKEELDLEVVVEDKFMSLIHAYPDFDIDFHVYRCRITGGELRCLAVHDFRWVELSDLERYDFPPADQPTVKQLIS